MVELIAMSDSDKTKGKSGGESQKTRSAGTLVLDIGGRILYEADASSLVDHAIVIGRDRSCDWCTAGIDNTVSSRHAEISRKRGTVRIRDLGSRNGIQVGGKRVQEHRLRFGDTVMLGACKLAFERPRREKESGGAAYHRLEQINGPESGRTFELMGENDIVIGSDPTNPIFIPDTLVSRSHAKLSFKKDGSCWVSDLGSRNGTNVNGAPVAKDKERLLRDGDVLSTAYVEFRFLDKGAVHVNARIGAKLLVAAATIAVVVLGYSLWNMTRRDAGWYQARALAAAARWSPSSTPADFAVAFSLLDQAAVARNSNAYLAIIAKTRMEMEVWTNTISGWNDVRTLLGAGKWVSAQGRFHLLASWTWNADTATKAHQEAEAVQALVNAYLSSRIDLRRTNWESGREREVFAADASLLRKALGAAAEAGQYLDPLRGEAEELRSEMESSLRRLEAIPAALAALAPPEGAEPAKDAARVALRTLTLMRDEDVSHSEARKAEIKSEDFPYRNNEQYPYFSPMVAVRLDEALDPLRGLAGAEAAFEENASAIAAGRWDAMRNPLPLPSRELTDRYSAFMRHSSWLEERNALLCGTQGKLDGIRGGFQARLENLEKRKFGAFLSKEPPAFAMIRDKALLESVLSFVDGTTPLPDADSAEPVCAYDRFAGVFELGDFVAELAADASPVEAAASYEAAWRGRAWTSEIQQLRDGLAQLRGFRRFRDVDKSGLVKMVLDARPASGGNRCAAAFAAADRLVEEVAAWCDGDLARACAAAGSERASIFGGSVALLLASADDLRKEPARKRAEEVAAHWRHLQGELKNINRRAETDPLGTWREIVAKGFPANAAPFKGAWRHLREQEGK